MIHDYYGSKLKITSLEKWVEDKNNSFKKDKDKEKLDLEPTLLMKSRGVFYE